ncbi:hypothetical protein [Candidatus Nitrosocosmicus sp. SS]|uniref:hypothetical protein n=1 Tax=Candidatus Nitrosocosmicus agrestis TaxID=2563600 RepID=UPI00122E6517|nr:hypothetical protein [Candidatus Nitrosocosmicus sp. SS]KAF0867741.1 hypothetical protein E5N71_13685 [Candidatus Nitrosocosmicus sp. SS]MDR4491560.1 hypothetical protein [Candidatus Nitrosocosmicus sp.]
MSPKSLLSSNNGELIYINTWLEFIPVGKGFNLHVYAAKKCKNKILINFDCSQFKNLILDI